MIAFIIALTKEQNTLAIALLIPILGVVSPLLIAGQINRNSRAQKVLDWEREDKVAARAEAVAAKAAEAAELVIKRQEALDAKTDEVARLVASSTNETNTQLQKIHGLVNSQYTEAIKSELSATQDTLAMMSELIANNKKAGIEPTLQMESAFRGREAKIAELEETLRIREEADKQSQLVNAGPREVVIVNPEEKPVPVIAKEAAPAEVVIMNPEAIPIVDENKE